MKGDRQTLDLFGGEVEVAAPPATPPRVLSRPVERQPAVPVVADPIVEEDMVGPGIPVLERELDHVEPEDEVRVRVSEPKVWTVAEVNRSVKEMLEDYLPPLWVSGEVANWTAHRS